MTPATLDTDVTFVWVRTVQPGNTSPVILPAPSRLRKKTFSLADDGAADVDREPSAGLERGLEQHAPGHRAVAVLVEVPGVDGDVVLHRGFRARLHREALARHVRDARDEVIGRSGQARHLALARLEEGAGLVEGVGGPTEGARHHRGVVEAETVDVGSLPAADLVGDGRRPAARDCS